jgi:hypothetical protein
MTGQASAARLIVVTAAIVAVIGWGRSAACRGDRKLTAWTWAKSPRCSPEEEDPAADPACSAAIRLTAIAVARSGAAIVGGVVRGPIVFGPIRLHKREEARGFIGRIEMDGRMHVVRLLEEQHDEIRRWLEPAPTALTIDRRQHMLVSRRDSTLLEMNERGRIVRTSNGLPAPARSLLIATGGDIVATGCAVVSGSRAGQLDPVARNKNGYVERLTPKGDVLWTYHFRRETFLDSSSREDCGTALAAGPNGGVFVAGTFTGTDLSPFVGAKNVSSEGSFLARFSREGRLLWSRLMADNDSALALAPLPGGRVAVTGRRNAGAFLMVIDADGKDVWSATVDGPGMGTSTDLGQPVIAARDGALVWAGAFRAPVKIAGVALDGYVGDGNGLFFARFDADGKIASVIDVSRASRRPQDEAVMATAMSAGRSVWLAGTIDRSGPGVFAQELPQ